MKTKRTYLFLLVTMSIVIIILFVCLVSNQNIGTTSKGMAMVNSIFMPVENYVAGNPFDEIISDERTAATIADAIIKSYSGWKVVFCRPYTVSYDDIQSVWIVQGSGSIFGTMLGAWSSPTVVMKKNGELIACYSMQD